MHAFERQYVSYHITYILLTVINCILALTATTGNVLTLVAVWKTPSLQTPTNVPSLGTGCVRSGNRFVCAAWLRSEFNC